MQLHTPLYFNMILYTFNVILSDLLISLILLLSIHEFLCHITSPQFHNIQQQQEFHNLLIPV